MSWLRLIATVLAVLTTLSARPAAAQDAFPSKQLTLLVPFAPGGSLDLTARAFAPSLQRAIGQPVVVVNKPGAAGAVATQSYAVAPPDGYTILVTSTYIATLPAVDKLFGRQPTFSRHDFQPLALLSAEPVFLFVNAEQPWKSYAELAADLKAKKAVVFSSSGIYGATHVPVAMLLRATGLEMRHLPMGGGGPAMTAVLGGNAQVVAAYPAVGGPHAKAGKLRVLATWNGQRHAAFPDVPTFKELGVDIEYASWVGLLFAKGVGEPVVARMNELVRKAAADPEFKAALERAGSGMEYLDRQGFAAFYKTQGDRLEAVVQAIGKIE